MKTVRWVTLMVAFMCHALVLDAKDDVAALREHAYQKTCLSIAEVVHESPLGRELTCGFFIDMQGTLVTVLGMLGEPGVLSVIYGDKKYETELLTFDAYTRLALLKVKGVMAPAATLGTSTNLDVGDHVFSVNFSEKAEDRCLSGRIAGREKDFMGKTLPASLIRLNLKAGSESFGAPLVSSSGKVCGVVLLGMEDGKVDVSYALPVELVLKVQRDFVKHGKVEESWIGFGMEQGTTTPEVRTIQKGAPAEKAGLAVGDIIHTIGDRKVRDYQDVVDACYYLTPGDEIVFKVLRGLDDLDLRVTPEPRKKIAAPEPSE